MVWAPTQASYRKLFGPLVTNWDKLSSDVIGPLRFPRHPLVTARFGLLGLRSAVSVAQSHFEGETGQGAVRRESPHTRCCPLNAPSAPRSDSCWAQAATPSAGRCREAGHSEYPMRLPHISPLSEVKSKRA